MEIKYLENGQKVSYIGEAGGKYVIKYIYQDEDYEEEFESEKTELVSRVFDKAPVEVFDERVKAIQNQINDLNEVRTKARDELMKAKKEQEEFEKLYVNHPQFKVLKNVLEGRVNYYADLSDFTVEHAHGDRWEDVVYLRLYKNSGEFQWQLEGESKRVAIPCTSKGEAFELMREKIRSGFESGKEFNIYYRNKLIRAAKKFGVEVPDSFMEVERKREQEKAQEEIAKYERLIKQYQDRLKNLDEKILQPS